MRPSTLHILLPLTVVGAMALSACDSRDDQTVGQQMDESAQTAEGSIDNAQSNTNSAMSDAERMINESATSAGNRAESAGDRMEGQATDAAITARVNAALIADEQLKAGRIDVDTSAGEVTLRGDAPTEQARTHATDLVKSVDGVKAVDNELVVKPNP